MSTRRTDRGDVKVHTYSVLARQALAAAYGSPAGEAGSGGSIPLLHTLQAVAPNAEFIL